MLDKPFSLSVKVVILDDHGRCLLLKRSAASKANAGKWEFPGGKLDPGESFDQALLREVAEETGLVISLEKVSGSAQSESPDRKIAYLIMEARIVSGKVRISDEHDDFAWVPVAELIEMDLSPQFRAFADSLAADGETTSPQRTQRAQRD